MVHQTQVIGNIICGYRLTEYLGGGGMGDVYLGIHPESGEKVAVKFLTQLDTLDRFKNEALILSGVHHPGIARFIQFEIIDGRPLIVMEYVSGSTLGQALKKYGKLDFETAQRIFIKIVEAVAVLHQQGIIHRDLKPGNIKITEEGEVKLLDFGIAKTKRSPKLTQTGHAVGTIQYMSYEQLKGDASQASDVWSLGVLYYEMLTGSLPFDSQNIFNLKELIKKKAYMPVRVLNPEIPSQDEQLIAKCLKFKPASRFKNGGAMLASLQKQSSNNKLAFPVNIQLPDLPKIKLPISGNFNLRERTESLRNKFQAFPRKTQMTIYGSLGAVILLIFTLIFSGGNGANKVTIMISSDVSTASLYVPEDAFFGKTVKFPTYITKKQGTKLKLKVKKDGYETYVSPQEVEFRPNTKPLYIPLIKKRK